MTIGIVPTSAVPEPEPAPEDDDIAGAFADGWNAFVAVVYATVVVLAVMAPFLALALVVGLALWWAARRGPARHRLDTPTQQTEALSERDDVPTPTG